MRMWFNLQQELQFDQTNEEVQGPADLPDSTIVGAHISDVHVLRSANSTSARCQISKYENQTQPCEH